MALTTKSAFAGIDVACAKGKRLPVVVCRWREGRLVPEPLASLPFDPPVGRGNAAACDPQAVEAFAAEALEYLRRVEASLDVRIVRIGIDAPNAPRGEGMPRRAAEAALDKAGIRCFTTPSEADFRDIRNKVARHLQAGGRHSNLPHANQLWMLVGFELFRKLRELAECIEVYPQATVRQLGIGTKHKSEAGAVADQLAAAGRHTGWPSGTVKDIALKEIARGPRHDRLDAYLSAWTAALDEADRTALGTPPDDVIWVPRVREAAGAEPTEKVLPAARVPRDETPPRRCRKCPACSTEFKNFPLGWDAHAAHRCGGLDARDPEERKREYKRRFGHLF